MKHVVSSVQTELFPPEQDRHENEAMWRARFCETSFDES